MIIILTSLFNGKDSFTAIIDLQPEGHGRLISAQIFDSPLDPNREQETS